MRFAFPVVAILLLLSVGLLFVSFEQKPEEYLRVDFLDVGQGDAVLVTSPSGIQMLVDAGRDTSVLRSLGGVMDFSDRKIDVIVATHPDADHIGGFPDVLERYDVDMVLGVNAHSDTDIFESFTESMKNEGAVLVEAQRGQVIDLGAGVFVQVLFPYVGTTITGNDASVILKIIYKESEVLLTGDAGKGVEEHLVLREGSMLESDVLKIGHHGSKTSTSNIFLEVVAPVISIISAGENNRYKHPNAEVLETIAGAGVPHLGTYEEGTVTLFSDGKNIWRR